ncbi:MAG: spore cortex biosynthesis protein YabQ [Defluviitaleaceae bacterium]|nr:spore cortex biosynthesis protein YabQ [Defluviitaleaceae bacterium]
MTADLTGQALTFLITVLAGFAFGLVYDGFRIFRKMLRHSPLLTAVEDVLFWVLSALLLFALLMHVNFGQVRFFTFLGVALGIILYLCTLSRVIMPFGTRCALGLRKSAGKAKRGLHTSAKRVKMKGTSLARGVKVSMEQKIKRVDKVVKGRKVAFGLKTVLQLLILIVIIGVALYLATGLLGRINETNAQTAQIEAQIVQQEERQRELMDEAEYTQSIEFIENVARQHLHLLHRDEIIFIMIDED